MCFSYKEKFTYDHKCLKELMITKGENPQEEGPNEYIEDNIIELSINSILGVSTPRTMKLWEILYFWRITILIDSWATHNFISTKLVKELNIPMGITSHSMPLREHGQSSQVIEYAQI